MHHVSVMKFNKTRYQPAFLGQQKAIALVGFVIISIASSSPNIMISAFHIRLASRGVPVPIRARARAPISADTAVCTRELGRFPLGTSQRGIHCGRVSLAAVATSNSYESFSQSGSIDTMSQMSNMPKITPGTQLVLWRGEGTKGYSLQFRHLELRNAYSAVLSSMGMGQGMDPGVGTSKNRENTNTLVDLDLGMDFYDATPTVDELDDSYGAMQFVHLRGNKYADEADDIHTKVRTEAFIRASQRSSLLREIYSVISTGDTFEELIDGALKYASEDHMLAELRSNPQTDISWCVRLRQYGSGDDDNGNDESSSDHNANKTKGSKKGRNRFGTSKRSSMKREREALTAMKPLLETLHGKVQLKTPDCGLYIFEGLNDGRTTNSACSQNHNSKVLVRKVASGASSQTIAPNTRKCITRTPLCPLASFIMCNLGRVKNGDRVLDPYSGSCSTLLACAMVVTETSASKTDLDGEEEGKWIDDYPRIQMVGIELAGNDVVDREKIWMDFETRGLIPPKELIHGDCTDEVVRDIAMRSVSPDTGSRRGAVGEPFDVILADPPYGRRESTLKDMDPPLIQFIKCIRDDADNGKPLLKIGGRLVAFVPTGDDEKLEDNLPPQPLLDSAGLTLVSMTEQPLSDTLSRWLAVYVYVADQ